jgi:acylphosphatase
VSASEGDAKARWRIHGRVQGVGFRWFAREAAERHRVRGDARNMPDGTVEVRVRGPAESLARLLEELRRGPRGARVEAVEALDATGVPDFAGFVIRHAG